MRTRKVIQAEIALHQANIESLQEELGEVMHTEMVDVPLELVKRYVENTHNSIVVYPASHDAYWNDRNRQKVTWNMSSNRVYVGGYPRSDYVNEKTGCRMHKSDQGYIDLIMEMGNNDQTE